MAGVGPETAAWDMAEACDDEVADGIEAPGTTTPAIAGAAGPCCTTGAEVAAGTPKSRVNAVAPAWRAAGDNPSRAAM
jgi:hypothetical protein